MENKPVLIVPTHLHLESSSQLLFLSKVNRKHSKSGLEAVLCLCKMAISCKVLSQVDVVDYPVPHLVGLGFELSFHCFRKVLNTKLVFASLSVCLSKVENGHSVLILKPGFVEATVDEESESLSVWCSLTCVLRCGSEQKVVLVVAVLNGWNVVNFCNSLVKQLCLLEERQALFLGTSVAVDDANSVVAVDNVVEVSQLQLKSQIVEDLEGLREELLRVC